MSNPIVDTIVGVLPQVFTGIRALAELVSPRAAVVAGYAEQLVTFAIQAERDGLSKEAVLQGIGDLHVQFLIDLKTGVA
jgi:hypothetical protein